MRKNFIGVALTIALVASIASCTTASVPMSKPADREAIQRALPMVAEYEKRRMELKKAITFLFAHGLLDPDSGQQVKESMDIEYVYYEASIISLAHGNMDDYRNFVQLAEQELDRAKTAVATRVQALQSKRAS